LNVQLLTDDDVEAHNRVERSALIPGDEHGPVPRVTVRHRQRSARTFRNREFLANQAARILRAAGATKVLRLGWPPVMLHIHSTMRMGVRDSDSVLDANAETRAVKRLFVADNGALANALGGPNPTLTTQALATRTAEKIFTRYFGGDAWVGRDAPVSSIDDVITNAVLGRTVAPAPAPAPVLAVTGGPGRAVVAGAVAAATAATVARRVVRE
jgi:choline dehydrogenase-like flavoprotein